MRQVRLNGGPLDGMAHEIELITPHIQVQCRRLMSFPAISLTAKTAPQVANDEVLIYRFSHIADLVPQYQYERRETRLGPCGIFGA